MSRFIRKKKIMMIGIITVLSIILLTVILISTGVIASIKKSINKKIYPLEHREIILTAAEEYNLDPAFVCAVIYTESKFREDATSSAGAMGLMQLMPETFEYLADKKGETVPKDIISPDININYGVFYLRYLKDTYSFADFYTTAAAYNAGPGAVTEWLKNEDYSKDGKTLHNIPYEETENYISKIKKAEQMYQSLYFDE